MELLPFLSEGDINWAISDAVKDCGRYVSDQEIEDAIENAGAYVWRRVSDLRASTPRWPVMNEQLRRELIAKTDMSLASLAEKSPVQCGRPASEEIIDLLFPGNPLICVGDRVNVFSTKPREDFRGTLESRQFIVPSTMSKPEGLTQSGRASQRCLNNTGPRRFAVVEFDTGAHDEHAALLWHIKSNLGLPLALVVHSGGKSLHGWFFCEACPEDQIAAFYRDCVALGADPATFTRSQLVRMPDGLRDGQRRQAVHYLDASCVEGGAPCKA